MRQHPITLFIWAVVLSMILGGCWLADRVESKEIKELRAALKQAEERTSQLRQTVQTLEPAAAVLGEKAVQALAEAKKLLDVAEGQLPQLKMAVEEAEKNVGKPRWEVGLLALWPFAGPLISKIPYVGVVGKPIADALWLAWRTRRQKEEEEEQERLAALAKKVNGVAS